MLSPSMPYNAVIHWTQNIYSHLLDSMRGFSHRRRLADDTTAQHPLAATKWAHPLLLHAVCSDCIPFIRTRGVSAVLSAFFVPGDLDL